MTHEMEPIAHLTFEAVPFDLTSLPTNEQDAKARRSMLPIVRIVGELARAKAAVGGLQKLLNAALTRSYVVLERLGYTPDNPPPDGSHDPDPPKSAPVPDQDSTWRHRNARALGYAPRLARERPPQPPGYAPGAGVSLF